MLKKKFLSIGALSLVLLNNFNSKKSEGKKRSINDINEEIKNARESIFEVDCKFSNLKGKYFTVIKGEIPLIYNDNLVFSDKQFRDVFACEAHGASWRTCSSAPKR